MRLSNQFLSISALEGTILIIIGAFSSIKNVSESNQLYFNRKGYTSLNFLLGVNCNNYVRYVYGGCYGSNHNSRIYRQSSLCNWVDNLPAGYHIIADSAYPQSPHLLKPVLGNLNIEDLAFNEKFIKQRIRVECAIGEVKQKFRIFYYEIIRGDNVFYSNLFICCCAMHNLIKKQAIIKS